MLNKNFMKNKYYQKFKRVACCNKGGKDNPVNLGRSTTTPAKSWIHLIYSDTFFKFYLDRTFCKIGRIGR